MGDWDLPSLSFSRKVYKNPGCKNAKISAMGKWGRGGSVIALTTELCIKRSQTNSGSNPEKLLYKKWGKAHNFWMQGRNSFTKVYKRISCKIAKNCYIGSEGIFSQKLIENRTTGCSQDRSRIEIRHCHDRRMDRPTARAMQHRLGTITAGLFTEYLQNDFQNIAKIAAFFTLLYEEISPKAHWKSNDRPDERYDIATTVA